MNPMTFEDLDSWQHAREMVSRIYHLTRHEPLCRDFGICSQLQRAGVSIMSNIAEGFERGHISEKAQFYNVARASAAEVRSLLYVVEDNFPKSAPATALLREQVVSVGKLISGLIRSTEGRRSRP
jgi:four helix bundle protein